MCNIAANRRYDTDSLDYDLPVLKKMQVFVKIIFNVSWLMHLISATCVWDVAGR